ncbi:MAG: hypothetical protein JRJ49_08725, partial [Deltaproteobacteria bacterium]|nr:hypothetical protein [Deltaproteobacteria bacterium]
DNRLYNALTGALDITSDVTGVLFEEEDRSEFKNEGAAIIEADEYGIRFYDVDNGIINNSSTGNFDIKGDKYGIGFENSVGGEFKNEGAAIIETKIIPIFFIRGENNKLHNALTGNLNIKI